MRRPLSPDKGDYPEEMSRGEIYIPRMRIGSEVYWGERELERSSDLNGSGDAICGCGLNLGVCLGEFLNSLEHGFASGSSEAIHVRRG